MEDTVETRVAAAVAAWLRWVPKWTPAAYRTRVRICGKCAGSPVLVAAGIPADTPHQVKHALVGRVQKIIDTAVDDYTAANLPLLHDELAGADLWNSGGYDPLEGLDPEYAGLDPDPEPDEAEQPFLFTFAELAEQARPEPPLPRPPLSAAEKQQLRREMELAEHCANDVGSQVCFALMTHRPSIEAAVERFVEPQVRALLDELAQQLEPPQ